MLPVRLACCCLGVAWCLAASALLRADPEVSSAPGNPTEEKHLGMLERNSLLPDPGGQRAELSKHGLDFALFYAGEVFGNPVGGYRQGAAYNGLVTAGLDVDFGKLAGWNGIKFHALAYETHGTSGTQRFTRDLNSFSSIDAYDSARLFELWLQASFFDNVVNLRVGQEAVDAEFATTVGGALFIHSNFGALPSLTLNVPTPTYPDAAPGARLRLNSPDKHFYFQTGVYAGNPNADRNGDPDPGFRAGTAYNDNGIRFPISGNQGLLAVFETGFLPNYLKGDPGLPGAYRLGGFYHTGTFSDERFDSAGRSRADPFSTGRARAHDGDAGFYAVAEQVVYRPGNPHGGNEDVAASAAAPIGNAEDSPLGLAGAPPPSGPQLRLFGRVGAESGDRNPVDFYLETGLNYRALIPGREQDVFGVGFTYTSLSGDLRRRARDANKFDGTRDALPDYEGIVEATYQINLAPWLSVQPDAQFILHPGGSARYDDALVLGVRTVVTF